MEKRRLQKTFGEALVREIGLTQFLRLGIEVKAVGNLSPMLCPYQPLIDFRK